MGMGAEGLLQCSIHNMCKKEPTLFDYYFNQTFNMKEGSHKFVNFKFNSQNVERHEVNCFFKGLGEGSVGEEGREVDL